MCDYLDFTVDYSDPDVVSVYDQAPLWSAMFGLMLFERIPMRRDQTVLDIGYGTGFPILELAEEYAGEHLTASTAAESGFVDEVIEPSDTRRRVGWALGALEGMR